MHLHVKRKALLPFLITDGFIRLASLIFTRASSHICHLLLSGSQVGATERGHTGQHIQVCKSALLRMLSGPLCLVASRFY